MRRISGILLVMLFMGTANAQQIRVGVHTGIDAARMRLYGAEGGPLKYKSELTGGLSVEAMFSSLVGVQLEGNYSQQGAGLINDDGSTAGSFGFDYITVPLVIKLHATPQLSFHAGPQLGILLSAKQKSNSSSPQDIKEQIEKTSYYAVFGSEYRFANGVNLGVRYNSGFGNIAKSPGVDLKNTYFTFRLGYSFSCKK
jgi:hypothetical protein